MGILKRNTALKTFAAIICLMFIAGLQQTVSAQTTDQSDLPSPRGALLRSFMVPGWGHYYAEQDNWNRGKYHLAAEAVFVLSYFGLNARSDYLEDSYVTLAKSKAGVDLSDKDRQYRIAIGNFDNLRDYNDAQLQLRNWNQVYPETAEFYWNWESNKERFQYQNTRERVDRHRSQLPSLIALMVANRLISGVSAFIHARNLSDNLPQAQLNYINEFGQPGITAKVRIEF